MGEVPVSSSEEVELEAVGDEVAERESWSKRQRTEKQDAVVQWEKFLPKMVLRVLLVEADDSTRQIIAALLRKCRYKVSAVPDGQKAWEMLKVKRHNIDLILTEVELPSISGFALLTLVMEHDICKNIPVIMMSSHDSMSMVLKCMLKGAADYLIKPVRKNELRNLWQHVWRRHAQNVEVGNEKNAANNNSSDNVVSSCQDMDGSEKGSDAQGLSLLKCKSSSNLSNSNIKKQECPKLPEEPVTPERETEEKSSKFVSKVAPFNEACVKGTSHYIGVESESTEKGNVTTEISGCNSEPFSGAIDLIGTFDNRPMCSHVHSNSITGGAKTFECIPQLELSLRRYCPSNLKDDEADERRALNHSNASAFSRYNNTKTLQSLFSALGGNDIELESTDKIQDLLSNHRSENTCGSLPQHGATATLDNNQENTTNLRNGQSGQAEISYPRPQLGLVPIPGLRFNDICAGYGDLFPSVFYAKSDIQSGWNLKPTSQPEQSPSVQTNAETSDVKQGYHRSDETLNNYEDQTVNEEKILKAMKELRDDSPAVGQSCSSSLCNGVNQVNSSEYGYISRSDGDASAVMEKVNVAVSLYDSGFISQDGLRGTACHRASQREEALKKFRQKRKDRCYEKKVRYQSRKKLAEQRPRVKGQFVRQMQTIVAGGDICPQES